LFVLLNIRVDGDNIKTHLNEIWREGVDGIHLTQDKILVLVFGRLLLLLEALQFQRRFGLLNEFLPFDPVSDAVLPVSYFHPCYITLYITLPSIFRSS
jgi:hypothetical protein